jgi:hypothetical protein
MLYLTALPRSDVRCRRCDGPLAEAVIVFERSEDRALPSPRGASRWYHPACAVDVDAAAARAALDRAPAVAFAERAEIEALADARIAAKAQANRKRKPRADDPPTQPVEPARDPLGRPRVRVLLLGSSPLFAAEGVANTSLDALTTLVDMTVRSSLREYVLQWHSSMVSVQLDPSQPFVAAIYWQKTDVGVAHTNRGKLIEWAAMGVSPPIIAVLGPGADRAALCDPLVLSLRAMLAKAGFSADESPVVCAASADQGFYESLAAALDERAELASGELSVERVARAIENLERLRAEERDEAILPAFTRTARMFNRARVAEKQRIVECALWCASRHGLWADATDVLELAARTSSTRVSREALLAAVRATLDAKARLPPQFERLCALWPAADGPDEPALWNTLIDAATSEKPTTDRAKRVASVLARTAPSAIADALRTRADGLARKRAQQDFLRQIAARIDARRAR